MKSFATRSKRASKRSGPRYSGSPATSTRTTSTTERQRRERLQRRQEAGRRLLHLTASQARLKRAEQRLAAARGELAKVGKVERAITAAEAARPVRRYGDKRDVERHRREIAELREALEAGFASFEFQTHAPALVEGAGVDLRTLRPRAAAEALVQRSELELCTARAALGDEGAWERLEAMADEGDLDAGRAVYARRLRARAAERRRVPAPQPAPS